MSSYLETVKYFNEIKNKYPVKTNASVINTKIYDVSNFKCSKVGNRYNSKQTIEVENMDSFDFAKRLIDQGMDPLVLNLASDYTPGGGWRRGAMAQEETLFYRSTYAFSLEHNVWITNPKKSWDYPLGKYHQVYTPDVFVFKDSNYNTMDWESCYWVDCLAVAGIINPHYQTNGLYHDDDYQLMKTKLTGIFEIAKEHGNDSLVLGAIGCGAFGNTPGNVAKLFKKIINDNKYDMDFKIVFAVKSNNNNMNYKVFHDTLDNRVTLNA